tara:strand:+ start:8065 stop:9063 length:999 start_codon:yes stop_codon:yes gene_type:complete
LKKVLITGADGFIGSHLTETLVKQGYDVKAFIYYNSFGSKGWLDHTDNEIKKEINFFAGDIRDPNGVRQAVKNVDYILHLASLIGIPFSYHSPDSYIDTNVKGTLNILQAAKDFNIAQIIHTSTSEVYGTAKEVPIKENHPLAGQSPYSASKIGADQLAFSFFSSFDMPVSIIRPFNTYGPRQSARAIIPSVISQIANKNEFVKLGSLHPTRDFSYIEDTVQGFLNAINNKRTIGEVINLGSSFEISIGDTANLISKIMRREIKIKVEEDRIRPPKSEVERLFACNKKAKLLLNWSPKFSGIKGFTKGLEKTISWFIKNENLSKINTNIYNI